MKTKKYLLIIIVLLPIINLGQVVPLKKMVIGARSAGFFSNFFAVLNTLAWCERNDTVPVVYWDHRFPYWQNEGYNGALHNAWEYYFEPVSDQTYQKNDKIYHRYFAPDRSGVPVLARNAIEAYRYWGYKLIQEYIKIKDPIQEKIDIFVEANFKNKKIVGIHLRGTDKKAEVKPVPPLKIFKEANKYKGCTYFVATDEQRLLDLAKKYLNGPVIYYDAQRSQSKKPLHEKQPGAQCGEDVLIEVILLSMCDAFIHTCSNVAYAVLCFNPTLKHTLMSLS